MARFDPGAFSLIADWRISIRPFGKKQFFWRTFLTCKTLLPGELFLVCTVFWRQFWSSRVHFVQNSSFRNFARFFLLKVSKFRVLFALFIFVTALFIAVVFLTQFQSFFLDSLAIWVQTVLLGTPSRCLLSRWANVDFIRLDLSSLRLYLSPFLF